MSQNLGFIAGSNLLDHEPFRGAAAERVETPYGDASVYSGRQWTLVLRHGPAGALAPHKINYHANIDALRRAGCNGIVSLCSVGSVRSEIRPDSIVVASDFINLAPVLTYNDFAGDEPVRHVAPGLSERLRKDIIAALDRLGEEYGREGIYYQSIGPRFETHAEIRMIANFADVVGMTFGHEATLCAEAGIETAAICSVDNMAHGLPGGESVSGEAVDAEKARKGGRIAAIARELLEPREPG